jgi:nonsense-mediated mRNA decay protein 3
MCETCLRARVKLSTMPERIQQDRCSKCGFFEVRGRWTEIEGDSLADLRIRENLMVEDRSKQVSVSFAVEPIDERTSRLHVDVGGVVESHEFSDSHSVLLQTSNAVCPTCTRKAGSYFEAVMQLRSAGRRLEEEELESLRSTLDEMLSAMEPDPMFFISEEGKVTGGWDLKLGSKAMARRWARDLVRKFGGTVKETSTVIGANDGIEVSRLTLSYRKPAYGIGDVLNFRGSLWLVESWQKEGPILRKMNRFERSGFSWRDMEASSVVCSYPEQHVVSILNRDSSAAEVMDPTDFKVVAVALPYDDDGNSDELRIGFIEDEWLAIPVAGRGESN